MSGMRQVKRKYGGILGQAGWEDPQIQTARKAVLKDFWDLSPESHQTEEKLSRGSETVSYLYLEQSRQQAWPGKHMPYMGISQRRDPYVFWHQKGGGSGNIVGIK